MPLNALRDGFVDAVIRGASLCGVGVLMLMQDSGPALAIWGVLITSVAGLIKQYLDARTAAERDEREHRFANEDRLRAQEARAAIQQSIAENTQLTAAAATKAEQAFDAANHVNDKIANIAHTALVLERRRNEDV